MRPSEINFVAKARRPPRRARIDHASILRYRALSGRKVVIGRLLPRTDVAVTSGDAA